MNTRRRQSLSCVIACMCVAIPCATAWGVWTINDPQDGSTFQAHDEVVGRGVADTTGSRWFSFYYKDAAGNNHFERSVEATAQEVMDDPPMYEWVAICLPDQDGWTVSPDGEGGTPEPDHYTRIRNAMNTANDDRTGPHTVVQ